MRGDLNDEEFQKKMNHLHNEISMGERVFKGGCKNLHGIMEHKKSTNNYYLIQEASNCGSLARLIEMRGGFLHENEVQIILRQLVNAVKELKKFQIVHRAITTENVLVFSE